MNPQSLVRSSGLVLIGLFLVSSPASPQVLKGSKPAINVKLGLWEQTTVVQTSGVPALDPKDTAKMTPEQRARLDAAMKAAMKRAAAPHTVRICLTKEKLEKSLFEDNDKSCRHTVVTNTATTYEIQSECGGAQPSRSQWRYEALTPESVKGTGKVTLPEDKMTSAATMTAKWISASCGDVK